MYGKIILSATPAPRIQRPIFMKLCELRVYINAWIAINRIDDTFNTKIIKLSNSAFISLKPVTLSFTICIKLCGVLWT